MGQMVAVTIFPSPLPIPFPGLVFGLGLGTRRIQAEDAAALFPPRLDPFLELVLRRGLGGDFLGHLRRDDHDPFLVADHHVARVNGDAAAADGYLALDRVVAYEVERRGARAAVRRPWQLLDRLRVSQ